MLTHPATTARSDQGSRDLLPWADPYITRLAERHRLQAALHDSIVHLDQCHTRHRERPAERVPRERRPTDD